MGLAGAKNKRKLGTDPNNTKWSRNTDSFGQRMLRSQGWEPGQYLGAKDAPHAEWHTEASSTHIRVVLKDDQLGLGAKRNNGDECTGLDAFQTLLGRLNGKSETTLEAEQRAREDVKLNLYVERKLGTIRFVKGGWLVGDQMKEQDVVKGEEPQKDTEEESSTSSAIEEVKEKRSEKKSKKRKADQDADESSAKESKKDKKSKKRKTSGDTETDDDLGKAKKKQKKRKQRKGSDEQDSETHSTSEEPAPAKETTKGVETSDSEPKKSKKEKKDKKDKKGNKDKEKRRKEKSAADSESSKAGDDISKEKKRRKDGGESTSLAEEALDTSVPSTGSTPAGSGYSTPVPGSTKYLSRRRFIAQKAMAFADPVALNQIFMIKS